MKVTSKTVRDLATRIAAGQAGDAEQLLAIAELLNGYAERLKVEESSSPVGHFIENAPGAWIQAHGDLGSTEHAVALYAKTPLLAAQVSELRTVLAMVQTNQRIRDGERGKAWDGQFVARCVRDVLEATAPGLTSAGGATTDRQAEPVATVAMSNRQDALGSRMTFTCLTEAGKQLPAGKHALYVQTASLSSTFAYALGWRRAALWAERDDLIADIGSPAFDRDQFTDLTPSQATPDAASASVPADHPAVLAAWRMNSPAWPGQAEGEPAPEGWAPIPAHFPRTWRAAVAYAVETLQAEAEIRDNDDVGNGTMKAHTTVLQRMLDPAKPAR